MLVNKINEFNQFSSVTQLCLTLCKPMDCSTSGLPVRHQLPELLKLMSTESVMPSNHLILCHPLLLLPSIFPSIRIFPNESDSHQAAKVRVSIACCSNSFKIPIHSFVCLVFYKFFTKQTRFVQGCSPSIQQYKT